MQAEIFKVRLGPEKIYEIFILGGFGLNVIDKFIECLYLSGQYKRYRLCLKFALLEQLDVFQFG